jgi:predicted metal-dependent hydrolase
MKRETILNINGIDYEATIEYKATNYIKYRLQDNKIVIRCPYFISKDYLVDLIEKKGFKHSKNNKIHPFGTDYCYIYGTKEKIDGGFINIDGHFVLFNKDTFYKDINKYFSDYITSRIRYYENLMGIDVPYKITCRLVSTRYGSNSKRTHHITMNCYLVHFSKDIIDAIVVHELAHNFYYDHSKNFYDYIYRFCPNYKELHKNLRLGNFEGVEK